LLPIYGFEGSARDFGAQQFIALMLCLEAVGVPGLHRIVAGREQQAGA